MFLFYELYSFNNYTDLNWLTGAVILLGKTNMFRFNHPAQAAMLRKESKVTPANPRPNVSLFGPAS